MAREAYEAHDDAEYGRRNDGDCGDLDRVEHAHQEGSGHVIRIGERDQRLTDVESGGIAEEGKAAVDVAFRKIVRHVHRDGGKEAHEDEDQHGLNRIFAALSGLLALLPSSVAVNTKRFPG